MPSIGAQAVAKTAELMTRFVDAPLEIEHREHSIVLKPQAPDSFEVAVYDEGDEAMVAADRWHSHYDDPEQAAYCAMWLLTPFYRVVHELKGGLLAAVWIECYEADGWLGFEPVYYLNPSYAKDWVLSPGQQFVRRYVQQAVLPSPKPYEEFVPGAKLDTDGLPANSKVGVHMENGPEPISPGLFDG